MQTQIDHADGAVTPVWIIYADENQCREWNTSEGLGLYDGDETYTPGFYWYLTVSDGIIYLNWELSAEKTIDLYLEKARSFSIDFFIGDLNVSEIDPDLASLGSWIPFEMIDLWELDKIIKLCENWHVRCMLYVQDQPHTPKLFE